MKFWISWYEPSEDSRPVVVPDQGFVPGYWCSGACFDGTMSMCALVNATDEANAKEIVREFWGHKSDGIKTQWRFCHEKPSDWLPGDRFPIKVPPNKREVTPHA